MAKAMAPSSLLAALVGVLLFSYAAAIHLPRAGLTAAAASNGGDTKVYVVFTERQPATAELAEEEAGAAIAALHHDMIGSVLLDDSSNAADRVVYHYSRSLHGFAARLTEDEKNRLAGMDGVVYRPQTTRSWDFLGLPQHNDPVRLPFENDVIIGMLDTGISPDSESFSDDGLPPPPAKWKGVCSKNFTSCNNKIIGARAYYNGDRTVSVLDDEGHGTHTSSTAAGRAVAGASLGGLAGGIARGAVPGARLAVYKVCFGEEGCSSEDILAAFDDAIADGVDVISASIGMVMPLDYPEDPLSVGAFHAMKRGVVTSVSAGNSGPILGTVSNVSPWTEHLQGKKYKGAVLLCGSGVLTSSSAMYSTGAEGAVMYSTQYDDNTTAFSYALPTVIIPKDDYDHMMDYYNKSRHPMAIVKKSVTVKNTAAPTVAKFSSRGPNQVTYGVLKPDISAPGVDILAAWSPMASLSGDDVDERRVKYNIISGTSMSCPHVTGAAAYVKSVHPSWSHAAVLSALVTTATPMSSGDPEAELAYGAGQVNPMGARYPGLVYDASVEDYVDFLCAQGYNSTQLAAMTGSSSTACSDEARSGNVGDLNYPSISVPVINHGVSFAAEFPRTVTNVGPDDSVYRATVTTVPGVDVDVTPDELAFSAGTKKLSFKVTVSGKLLPSNTTMGASASVVWSDGRHSVRSPIYVFPHKHVM
nr:unnamed protein product [Digitaria exilis]